MSEAAPYVGRFAPSPTGPLHFGSLLAAAASYLQARRHRGRWLLRVENIDPPREQPGADTEILRALEAYGFEWHGDVLYQQDRRQRHLEIVRELLADGHAYRCGCSRKDLESAARGPLGTIYPGTCRAGSDAAEFAIRLRTGNLPISFTDRLQGPMSQRLESESGDFVIQRRDGLVAYHLAVVVDDADQAITEIVRGIDLLDSTPRHIFLQRLLGFPTPAYLHIPVAVNHDGQKLSKLTGADAIDIGRPVPTLLAALRALELPVTADLAACSVASIWAWADLHWQAERLAGRHSIVGHSDPLAIP